MPTAQVRLSTAVWLVLIVSACGGGGGGRKVASAAPPPTSPPTPPPTPSAVELFENAATQEFAALSSGGTDDQIRIRYDAATKTYEVLVPGETWQALRLSSRYSSVPPRYFEFGPPDARFFQTYEHYKDNPPSGYRYSNLAAWGRGVGAYWDNPDYVAFGIATPAGAVPVTGIASYDGFIGGQTNLLQQDYLVGGMIEATVGGSVNLRFDFGAGTLDGAVHPRLNTFESIYDLGTLSFADTVYSSGSTNFSGRFDTSLVGPNSFLGLFTGPNAEELIGRWEFPFVYPADGKTYDATGAWIAKK